MSSIPERPRLGDHVQARRQVVGEEPRVVLHLDDGRALVVGEREWGVLRQADGTRDLDGILLAAARAGVRVTTAHARAFFTELAALGLLEERAAEMDPSFAGDLPLAPLPGYRFRCTGRGQCCRQYDTILLSPLDVARARATLPELRDAGTEPERMFMPARGGSSFLSVVTKVDGACAYLDTHGGCRLHAAGGADAKPRSCRIYPAQLLDVGDSIRVAPRTECACVFASVGGEDGEPLVSATRGSELPREMFVPRLPPEIPMGGRRVAPVELVRFFDALAPSGDLAAYCWRLADAVAAAGPDARDDALPELDVPAVRRAFAASAASAARLESLLGTWRGPRDGARRGLAWARAALDTLLGPTLEAKAREPDDETFYLRSAFYLTLGAGSSTETELRARAVAIWVARAFPDAARTTPEAAHPLAIVEALARGHGLELTPHEDVTSG